MSVTKVPKAHSRRTFWCFIWGMKLVSSDELSLTSNQRAIQLLARDVLCRDVGDRLPTSAQYREQFGVGSGTVQKALRILEDAGAAAFTSRGHQGTFVVGRHIGRLWAMGELGVVTAAMPLPDSPEGAGLGAALRDEFDRLGIPLQMRYMYGSGKRLDAVSAGRADFAVLSAGAAANARSSWRGGNWIERDLGPYSYYREGSLVVLERPGLCEGDGEGVRTIGISRDSYDQSRLTLAEFPESGDYRYEEHECLQIPAAVAGGLIDTAVWHRITLPIPLEMLGVTSRPLARPDAVAAIDVLSRGVALAAGASPQIEALVLRLDVERIKDVQGRVIRGEMPPVF